MKPNKTVRLLRLGACCLALLTAASCSDWTDTEVVDSRVEKPWQQDPALWAEYTAALRSYKQREHFLVYARLHNSPEVATSEKDFMRSLPDSLDIVSLTNGDNFSTFDREDMAIMRQKGTKVLYRVDYAGRAGEFTAATLGAYLDKVVAAVKAENLDGYSFTGIPSMTDPSAAEAAALIVGKLSAEAGKLLVFEGNPLFVASADHAKVDYFILDTEHTQTAGDVKLQVLNALNFAAVPAGKIMLAARANAPLTDEARNEYPAIEEMARRVISFGPLAGLACDNIAADYYHADKNYSTIRGAIQTLNPSK